MSLTCDQVGERAHRALQLCCGSWVPPHVLGVSLVNAAQSVDVLFGERHYSCDALLIESGVFESVTCVQV